MDGVEKVNGFGFLINDDDDVDVEDTLGVIVTAAAVVTLPGVTGTEEAADGVGVCGLVVVDINSCCCC